MTVYQDDFPEISTAFLNAPNKAVSCIFSLAPVDSLCLQERISWATVNQSEVH